MVGFFFLFCACDYLFMFYCELFTIYGAKFMKPNVTYLTYN